MRGIEHAVRKRMERIQTNHTANRRWISTFNRTYSSFLTHRQRTRIVTPIASYPSFPIHTNHAQPEFHHSSSSHSILLSSSYRFEYVISTYSQFQIYPLMVNRKEEVKKDSFSPLAVKNDSTQEKEWEQDQKMRRQNHSYYKNPIFTYLSNVNPLFLSNNNYQESYILYARTNARKKDF